MHPELKVLYRSLEVDFVPLKMSANLQSSFEFIQQNEISMYKESLEDVVIMKILQQVGNM